MQSLSRENIFYYTDAKSWLDKILIHVDAKNVKRDSRIALVCIMYDRRWCKNV